MRRRSNLIILFGVAFFFVGAAIVFIVLQDDDDDDGPTRTPSGELVSNTVNVITATVDIAANSFGDDVIESGVLEVEQIAAADAPPGAIDQVSDLANQIIVTPIPAGTPITTAGLQIRSLSNIPVPEGFEAVAVQTDFVKGGARYVARNDRVNVFGLFDAGTIDEEKLPEGFEFAPLPHVELILTNVLVLDVSGQAATSTDAATAADDPTEATTADRRTPTSPITLLLAVRTEDAERLILLDDFGDFHVSLVARQNGAAGDTGGRNPTTIGGPVSAGSAADPTETP